MACQCWIPSVFQAQGRRQKYERGVSKRESKIWLINIHDIHTSVLITSQTCGVLVSRDIGAESPMLRPKVLILHADTWINARTIILNLILSGSDTLMAPRVESVHVLKQWIIICAYTLIATYKCRLLRTSIYTSNWELRDVVASAIITKWNQLNIYVLVKNVWFLWIIIIIGLRFPRCNSLQPPSRYFPHSPLNALYTLRRTAKS